MKLTSWGKYPYIETIGESFETPVQLNRCLKKTGDCIAHGMGRSYGDSALNERVIFSSCFNKILDFNPTNGIITCESGVTLAELIEIFLPKGWFLSVTPGTRFITIGGAIASDVHGKNHHKAGCFSECVLSFDLMLPDGEIAHCTRGDNKELFHATCGGMGLTGIILTVTFKLQPVQGAFIRETIIPCQNLEEIFSCFEAHKAISYSVAWIDCLAKEENVGRSVLMLGEHATSGHLRLPKPKQLSIPLNLPDICLNKYSVSLFNYFYYQKNNSFIDGKLVSLDTFFYPLDSIENWNRMYGRKGFTQYQLVLPKESSFNGLKTILEKIALTGMGSFLGVLKLFGHENENHLSFPMEGYTLALDFKIQDRLFPFLNELDSIVLDHGGRLYLTKDVRMSRDVFIKGYPRWERFAELREKYKMKDKFNSLQSKRLGI